MDIDQIKGFGAPDVAKDEEAPPSIVINPHTELGKELRKWEQFNSYLTPPGTRPGNPYVFREYPKMLYRARTINGKAHVLRETPDPYSYDPRHPELYQRACLEVEDWNRQAVLTVRDASEEAIAKGQGWWLSQHDAMGAYWQQQSAISDEAANAAFHVKRMTPGAQAEYKAVGEETHEHVVDVTSAPKKRTGWPKGKPRKKARAVTGSGTIESEP